MGIFTFMSHFRTVLNLPPAPFQIGLKDAVFTTGSCFSDNIGLLFNTHKFRVSINPFGTTYNPISIHKALLYAIRNEVPPKDTYGDLNDTHFNYDFHSSLSTLDRGLLEKNIERTIQLAHEFLKSTKVLLITYGTSWVFERNDTHEIVSNCHKMPASNFTRSLLTQKRILESFELLHKELKELNPALKIILTVSPVRHIKDTLELNAVSKSILRLTCHTLSELYSEVAYFPAYEIVLDDLRDYRFYDRDLLHPSPEAIQYIWDLFGQRYFSPDTQQFIKKWDELTKALNHKPFHPTSTSHQQFLKRLSQQLEELKGLVNVDKEMAQVRKQLIAEG